MIIPWNNLPIMGGVQMQLERVLDSLIQASFPREGGTSVGCLPRESADQGLFNQLPSFPRLPRTCISLHLIS